MLVLLLQMVRLPIIADGDFTAYVCGKNNGKLVKGAAPTGCVYKFETANAGTLTVAIQMGATKGSIFWMLILLR